MPREDTVERETTFSVGVVVACEGEEAEAFYANHPEPDTMWPMTGFPVAEYSDIRGKRVYFMITGPGLIDAACATQELISDFGPDLIIKVGLAGGLTPYERRGEVYVVEGAIDASYNAPGSIPGQHGEESRIMRPDEGLALLASQILDAETRVVATTNYFVKECGVRKKLGDGMDKSELHALCPSAGLVDMESAAVIRVCNRNELPCIVIAGVTDDYREGVESYNEQARSISEDILVPALDILLQRVNII